MQYLTKKDVLKLLFDVWKMTGLCILVFTVMSFSFILLEHFIYLQAVATRHQTFSILNPEHHRAACYLL